MQASNSSIGGGLKRAVSDEQVDSWAYCEAEKKESRKDWRKKEAGCGCEIRHPNAKTISSHPNRSHPRGFVYFPLVPRLPSPGCFGEAVVFFRPLLESEVSGAIPGRQLEI
jgi:hypothetical protein